MKSKAETVGDKVYLTYIQDFDKGIDEKYTYRDMHLYSNKLGNGLSKLGVKTGTGISMMEINSPEFLFTVFATWKLGAYIVLINTALKGVTLQYIIDHSDSELLIIHWSMIDAYLDIKDELPKIKQVIVELSEVPEDFKLRFGERQEQLIKPIFSSLALKLFKIFSIRF